MSKKTHTRSKILLRAGHQSLLQRFETDCTKSLIRENFIDKVFPRQQFPDPMPPCEGYFVR
ncbi:hypothetical protein RBSWK_06496 [Rhodopirellula baltica SWK14]|uniref:Uncharacterized protein n=1 Tax=Rhodopirellula baltica SWK14 TaxID=993516 RepID=L7C746_RHOBT|nr:hypothetical protein RBSWK_06496 [Rhodopirellula baltica SWK14]